MQLPPITEQSTAAELLQGLERYIVLASEALEQKNMVDLSGLDGVVDALCARVMKLSKEEQRAYAEKLDELGSRLNILQRAMIDAQDAVKKELNISAARQKASRAYRQDK